MTAPWPGCAGTGGAEVVRAAVSAGRDKGWERFGRQEFLPAFCYWAGVGGGQGRGEDASTDDVCLAFQRTVRLRPVSLAW